MKILLLCTLLIVINNLINENFFQFQFSTFKKIYNKSYINIDEEKKRYNIFKKNYEKFGYMNEFSDVSDYKQALEQFKKTKVLPASIDWSSTLGDAKDQSKICGNCYAFSFISQIESQYSIKYGKTYRFSEQELLDCSEGIIGCNGGNSDKIQKFLSKRNYLAFEADYYPYSGKITPSQCNFMKDDTNKYTSSIKMNVDKVVYVKSIRKDKTRCIQSLLMKGPVGASINAEAFDNYQEGEIIENQCQDKKSNHAITIVGYDTYYNKKTKKNEIYWIVRNSWGTKFGENGYAKIKAGANICGIGDNIHYITVNWDSWCGEGCDDCKYYNKELVCNSCIDGYYYDDINEKCYKCKSNCKTCTNSEECDSCNDGYYLNNDVCYKCSKYCKKCTGPNDNQCDEWDIGTSEDTETFIDDEINNNCFCHASYLFKYISLIFLYLLF